MRCPLCGSGNIEGVDLCEECGASLSGETCAQPPRTPLEKRLMREPLATLSPQVPVTVAPDDTVGEVIALLARRRIGCVLVTRDNKLLGIFTERDALTKIGASLDQVGSQPVAQFMTAGPETLIPQDPIAFALNRMAVGGYRHVPLIKSGRPVGVISVRDVLAYLDRCFRPSAAETV